MKTSIPRTLLTAIPALAAAGCTENPAPRPNVIFILMDDAGYGDFGCYGQQKIETPNIDALSECGVRFTDMYSAAPLSSPARCGLLKAGSNPPRWWQRTARLQTGFPPRFS